MNPPQMNGISASRMNTRPHAAAAKSRRIATTVHAFEFLSAQFGCVLSATLSALSKS